MSAVSKSEMSAVIAALAEVICEVRAIPSGHLYAQCMGHMTIEVYEKAIGLLKRAELDFREHEPLPLIAGWVALEVGERYRGDGSRRRGRGGLDRRRCGGRRRGWRLPLVRAKPRLA